MKMLLALAAFWTGTPGTGPVPAAPTYARGPVRLREGAESGASRARAVVDEASFRITNFASLDNREGDHPVPSNGIRLAAAAQNDSAKTTPPAKPAIYGHNVDDVVIGNMHSKGPTVRGAADAQKGAIYNGTITSEPTNTLRCAEPAHGPAIGGIKPGPAGGCGPSGNMSGRPGPGPQPSGQQ